MSDRQTLKEIKPPDEDADSNNGEAISYYYDNSTGYESYDAEDDGDEEEGSEDESHNAES